MTLAQPLEAPSDKSASEGVVDGDRLLGATEVAELIQISRETVNVRRKAGFLPSVRRQDGSYGFPEAAIRRLLGLGPGERLLRRKEVAARLEVGRQTVTDWHKAGKLRAVLVPGGRERRYLERDVERVREEIRARLDR